jgi:hypothetical protein
MHTPLEAAKGISTSHNLQAVATYKSLYAIVKEQYQHEARTLQTKMVEVNGIEPMTPCVQGRCSPS